MSILGFFTAAIKPVTDLIDNLHTSDEEREKVRSQVLSMQNQMMGKVLELETQKLEAQSQIITAEANGESWLQRSWRPITMLTFLGLVVGDSFGWLASELAPEAWSLLQIGLGGYVVGRSGEKIISKMKGAKWKQ
ncbi:MAG: holin family protein [Xanthomonadaceae bacterium]|nr:holin family protein [Xanthomonadaceae bacterium]